MNTVFLQASLAPKEIAQLEEEFPQYQFILPQQAVDWTRVEILYGNQLTPQQLAQAHALHWVHTPSLHLNQLCLDELIEHTNILVTTANEEDTLQTAEFVMAGVLGFAKQLFHWQDAKKESDNLFADPLRKKIWSLQQRTFLQIGLGSTGTEIARMAQGLNLQVWGVQPHPSFHPYCDKTIATDEILSVLPLVDIVCLSLPERKTSKHFLTFNELKLMKEDSLLIVIGSHIIEKEDLIKIAETGKLRGILLDATSGDSHLEVLKRIPNLIMTPEAFCCPETPNKQIFRCFHFNLRQYCSGNYVDMRNRIDN